MIEQQIKDYISERLEWWIYALGLQYNEIDLEIRDYIESVDENGSFVNPNLAGRCETDWRYMKSTIKLSMLKLKDMSQDRIEKALVHELMHIFLNEMREGGQAHEERVATMLQKAFIWVRNIASDGERE